MRVLSMLLLIPFAGSPQRPSDARARAGYAEETVHIGVQARHLDGSPIEGLQSKDFVVLAQGVRLTVASSQSKVPAKSAATDLPVHALLMIAASSEVSSESALIGLLTRELPKSFGNMQLAVFQRNSQVTAYTSNRAELAVQLQGFHNRRLSSARALEELGGYPGRHALIYYTEKGVGLPGTLRRRASAAAALIYQVGGNREKNYVQGSEQTAGLPSISQGDHFFYGPADDLHGGVGILSPAEVHAAVWTKSIRQVIVEHSLKRAFRDLAEDGLGYYDLSLTITPETASLDLSVNASQDYQLTAQPYTLDRRTPPELHLPTRQ